MKFRLSSLMLIVTLVCVCLGAASFAPRLIPLIALGGLALMRTAGYVRDRRDAGFEPTRWEGYSAFMASIGIVVVLGCAVGCALLLTCAAGFWGALFAVNIPAAKGFEWYGFAGGIILGLGFGGWWLYRVGSRLWPPQTPGKPHLAKVNR